MGDVVKFVRKTPATDREKAALAIRVLRIARNYIAYAQNNGAYDGWDYGGEELIQIIDQLTGDHHGTTDGFEH